MLTILLIGKQTDACQIPNENSTPYVICYDLNQSTIRRTCSLDLITHTSFEMGRFSIQVDQIMGCLVGLISLAIVTRV